MPRYLTGSRFRPVRHRLRRNPSEIRETRRCETDRQVEIPAEQRRPAEGRSAHITGKQFGVFGAKVLPICRVK